MTLDSRTTKRAVACFPDGCTDPPAHAFTCGLGFRVCGVVCGREPLSLDSVAEYGLDREESAALSDSATPQRASSHRRHNVVRAQRKVLGLSETGLLPTSDAPRQRGETETPDHRLARVSHRRPPLPSACVAQAATVDDKLCWPPHREARGFVTLRSNPTSHIDIPAFLSWQFNVLTVFFENGTGGTAQLKKTKIPTRQLVVTLFPGQVDMFSLSSGSCTSEFCCVCKDQTHRNKWVAVLRRLEGTSFRSDADRSKFIILK